MIAVERLAELRALAEAATPGKWERGSGSATVWTAGDVHLHIAECETDERGLPPSETMQAVANADYIAALPPEVTLALVREALAGREVAQAFKAYISEFGIEHGGERDEDENDYPCPEDDTCRCEHVEHINRVIAAYDAARAGERGT
jgi:hypothetical protein